MFLRKPTFIVMKLFGGRKTCACSRVIYMIEDLAWTSQCVDDCSLVSTGIEPGLLTFDSDANMMKGNTDIKLFFKHGNDELIGVAQQYAYD